MSTPSGPGPSDAKEERRKSLGKYVKRMSSVFKREKSTKGESTPAVSTPAAPSAPAPQVELEKESTTPAPAAAPTPVEPAVSAAPIPVTQELNRAALQQERARALFAKYGLTLESHEWITATPQPISVQRVERPIRMRVHRNCHHCNASFGPDKVCPKCEHKRCTKCPRFPKKKAPTEKKEQENVDAVKKKKKNILTITCKNGEERVYQPVKQRVRRSCHQCQTVFTPATATVCEQCRHVRCTRCPREPAKLSKWPHGYPGDAAAESETDVDRPFESKRIWRKPRQKVRWECEQCQSYFIDHTPHCPGCGHERCDKCTRTPLKKKKEQPQFDPAVIRAVEEKLRALAVGDEPNTSSGETT